MSSFGLPEIAAQFPAYNSSRLSVGSGFSREQHVTMFKMIHSTFYSAFRLHRTYQLKSCFFSPA